MIEVSFKINKHKYSFITTILLKFSISRFLIIKNFNILYYIIKISVQEIYSMSFVVDIKKTKIYFIFSIYFYVKLYLPQIY